MLKPLQHELHINASRDDYARQGFVAALRSHVLGDMAEHMRDRFQKRIASVRPTSCRRRVRKCMS